MPAESPFRNGDGTSYDLIETMRWERGAGFVRLDRHLERLANSAGELGFVHDAQRVAAALEAALVDAPVLRVRIALSADGAVRCAATPFSPQPADAIWKLRIARTRLDAGNPLLRHKTTRRAAYDSARAEFSPNEADEVILLNQAGQACEGAITSLFADLGDGVLKTPPLACGLLAGILRAEMLESGQSVESILTQNDLQSAHTLYVGNSLRGLIRARLET